MVDRLVWWACISLEVLLLIRAMRGRSLQTFPLFYCYILLVLTIDLISTPVYICYPSAYPLFYWTTELFLAAISYGVLVEIYNQSLKNYPGVGRFFRIFLLVMFFVAAIKVSAASLTSVPVSFGHAVAELERSLRQLQAVLLCCLLGLFVYYKIAVGKNLRGLIIGYSLVVSTEVIMLAFAFYPAAGFDPLMRKIEPMLYAISLFIWLSALWASRSEAATGLPCRIEEDYERLSRETRMMLVRARAHLARAARP
jgi:hypothetical protein